MMTNAGKKIMVIAGPTGSGKSSLAVWLAHRLGGEIVNADSMQVCRGMDVGTAKPDPETRENVPHHLFDVVDPDEDFNAALYRSLAVPVIEDVLGRGRPCFVVGGTGLYIKTLLGGLLSCPPSDPQVREELLRQWEVHGSEALHRTLARLDPEGAQKIHPRDKVRITRALEIMRITGRSLSSLAAEHGFRDKAFVSLKICLQIERKALYDRINERSVAMVRNGLIEETAGLLAKGYSPDLKSMKALGYRHAVRYLEGFVSLDAMVLELQRDTRRYAKRQVTWFRADPEMEWVAPEAREPLAEEIHAFLERGT